MTVNNRKFSEKTHQLALFLSKQTRPFEVNELARRCGLPATSARTFLYRMNRQTLVTAHEEERPVHEMIGKDGEIHYNMRRLKRTWTMSEGQYQAFLAYAGCDENFVIRLNGSTFMQSLIGGPKQFQPKTVPDNVTDKLSMLLRIVNSQTIFKDNPIIKNIIADYKVFQNLEDTKAMKDDNENITHKSSTKTRITERSV